VINFKLEVDPDDIRRTEKFLQSIPSIARIAPDVAAASLRVLAFLKSGTPVKTGLLRQSWKADIKQENSENKIQVDFHNVDPKAKKVLPILARGQKPHRIPRDIAHSKVLQFLGAKGDVMYRRSVSHPGAKPQFPDQMFKNIQAELAALKRKMQDLKEEAQP
jgi:hypothetical protein